jgi:hypothetical protein
VDDTLGKSSLKNNCGHLNLSGALLTVLLKGDAMQMIDQIKDKAITVQG